MPRSLIIPALVLLGALTLNAILDVGYVGIFLSALESAASLQVFADLAIALSLVMVWMWRDARATGRNIWPWLLATLALGSFGPLLYLLTRKA